VALDRKPLPTDETAHRPSVRSSTVTVAVLKAGDDARVVDSSMDATVATAIQPSTLETSRVVSMS